MLRTLVPAAAAAALVLAGHPAHAAGPAWTDADATLILDVTTIVGEAGCTAAAAEVAGLVYASATVQAVEFRGAQLVVGCTLWAGSAPVLEVTTGGAGTAAASGNDTAAALPDRACVWGWWLVETFEYGEFGSREC